MVAGTDTASTNFSQTVQTLIRKVLEDELLPNLPHLSPFNGLVPSKFLKGSNDTMKFLRIPYLALASDADIIGATAATAPWLSEGAAPTAQEFTFAYEEFTAHQAGGRVAISDIAAMESPLDLAAAGARLIARQAAATIDNYVGQVLAAGTNVLYSGAGNLARTSVGSTDVLTGSMVRRAVQNLKADSVPTFPDGTYHGIIHPAVVFDFEEDQDVGGWLDAARYRGSAAILDGELGKYAGVRFYESPSARTFTAGGAGAVDVYNTTIFGPGAYTVGDWGTLTTHVVPFTATTGNELGQLMSIGWKAFFGAMLIDSAGARYIRVESASGL
jgi:N4-gp56 family major capsid protein